MEADRSSQLGPDAQRISDRRAMQELKHQWGPKFSHVKPK